MIFFELLYECCFFKEAVDAFNLLGGLFVCFKVIYIQVVFRG